jgi:hypothetical protein
MEPEIVAAEKRPNRINPDSTIGAGEKDVISYSKIMTTRIRRPILILDPPKQ